MRFVQIQKNQSLHSVLKCSPFKAVFGHEPARMLQLNVVPNQLKHLVRFAGATQMNDVLLHSIQEDSDESNDEFEHADDLENEIAEDVFEDEVENDNQTSAKHKNSKIVPENAPQKKTNQEKDVVNKKLLMPRDPIHQVQVARSKLECRTELTTLVCVVRPIPQKMLQVKIKHKVKTQSSRATPTMIAKMNSARVKPSTKTSTIAIAMMSTRTNHIFYLATPVKMKTLR